MCPTMQTTRTYRKNLRRPRDGTGHEQLKRALEAERIRSLISSRSENVVDSSSPVEKEETTARALRTEMLKRRFMGTILNAQQKLLLSSGDGGSAARVSTEKTRAAAAAKEEEESERMLQRKRKREAARVSLEKMGRAVVVEEDVRDIQKFHNLYCGPRPAGGGGGGAHPLVRFGLVLKDDGDEEMDVEEGEIV